MDVYQKAADLIKKSRNMIALTGAGISVESGIPDFRSAGGLWDRYDPSVYASIHSFRKNPEKVWDMIFEMIEITGRAKPNKAHYALADLEKMNLLKAVITQNIDNLHQEAGNRNVIDFHGNTKNLVCMSCHSEYDVSDFRLSEKKIPCCGSCGSVLKPSVIFFGENIPTDAVYASQNYAESADVVLVIGTSAVVYPAAGIPRTAKRNGAKIIEFNLEETEITPYLTDIFIKGSVGKTLPDLLGYIKS